MNELHIASKPLLELLKESVGINLVVTKKNISIERSAFRYNHLMEQQLALQAMFDHITSLLKS